MFSRMSRSAGSLFRTRLGVLGVLCGLTTLVALSSFLSWWRPQELLYSGAALLGVRGDVSPWVQPLSQSWPVVNQWSRGLEEEYSRFVERLGQAVSQRRCRRLDACLRDPESNLLFDPKTDPSLSLDVDCGDLPYVLRGYFSFKRRLPFGFVCDVRGEGDDARYMSHVTPHRWCTFRQYNTPRSVLRNMTGEIHSGMYRMAPEIEDSDFYPLAVSRKSMRPGAVYYDPNGHVLVVGEIRADGTVFLMDGHPDGTLSWKRFGQAFALGGRSQGGGFKAFRPLRLVNDQLVRAGNGELPDFDGQSQWDRSLWPTNKVNGGYHAWVRSMLADPGQRPDPVLDFREQIRALCSDVSDRIEAVDLAIAAGIHKRPHPGELPWNIYGTVGDWEVYSTPSRDARLKAAFRELHESAATLPADSPLLPQLRAAWQEESQQPACRFSYKNSLGQPVPLGLSDVLERLFRLSFDCYHCPELRWGAPEGSAELASCPDDATKRSLFEKEQRLRSRIDREYGAPTPITEGPAEIPDLDVRRHLGTAR